MFTIKAFATHATLTNNRKGVVNSLGEISIEAQTYEKEVFQYTHETDKNIVTYVFKCTENNTDVEVPAEIQNQLNTFIKHVYDFVTTNKKVLSQQELLNGINRLVRQDYHSITMGEVVNDGVHYGPEWFRFQDNQNNEYIVWFSDVAFRSGYNDYKIEIILPVENVDIFYSNRTTVVNTLNNRKPTDLVRLANDVMGVNPVTIFKMNSYNWMGDKRSPVETLWYVLIWGEAGDNEDHIKEAIAQKILSLSTHTRDEWREIFPDIFKRNEFILVPQWDRYANENKVKEKASIYSTILDYKTAVSKYGFPYMRDVHETHVNEHLQFIGLYYRNIVATICSSQENKNEVFKITDIYPDFISQPSTSTDFNYQNQTTQEWSLRINEMLQIAETLTETSVLPVARTRVITDKVEAGSKIYSKVIRDGKLFLSTMFNGHHYLVAAKNNFVK